MSIVGSNLRHLGTALFPPTVLEQLTTKALLELTTPNWVGFRLVRFLMLLLLHVGSVMTVITSS